jgi:hypothetical protein
LPLTGWHFVKPCKVCHAILSSAAKMRRSRSVTPNSLRLIGAPKISPSERLSAMTATALAIRYSLFAAIPVGVATSHDRKVMAHAPYSNGLARDFAALVRRPTLWGGNFDPQNRPMASFALQGGNRLQFCSPPPTNFVKPTLRWRPFGI